MPPPRPALKPQAKQVAAYLRKYGRITPLKARAEIQVESLSRRIVDLKEAGYGIETVINRGFGKKKYAEYILKNMPDGKPYSAATALR